MTEKGPSMTEKYLDMTYASKADYLRLKVGIYRNMLRLSDYMQQKFG